MGFLLGPGPPMHPSIPPAAPPDVDTVAPPHRLKAVKAAEPVAAVTPRDRRTRAGPASHPGQRLGPYQS